MASAVPLVQRLLPQEDAVILCDPGTGEPQRLIVHPKVGQETVTLLLDVAAALDLCAHLEEESGHGETTAAGW